VLKCKIPPRTSRPCDHSFLSQRRRSDHCDLDFRGWIEAEGSIWIWKIDVAVDYGSTSTVDVDEDE
jgi:hypothetical protein